MTDRDTGQRRRKSPPKPLDRARLRDLALAYVARFSTSSSKLERYLRRKLRERGWEGDDDPQVEALVARYTELGYVDDALYAKQRAGGLLNRGYGPRRVAQTLYADGIDEHIRSRLEPGEYARREAVMVMARKRRFGPWFADSLDPVRRDKQIAALLRAGHGFDHIRAVLDAQDEAAVELWVEEARDEE